MWRGSNVAPKAKRTPLKRRESEGLEGVFFHQTLGTRFQYIMVSHQGCPLNQGYQATSSRFFHWSLLHQSGVDGVSRASERGTESLDVLQQRGGEPGEGRADRPPASLDLSLLTLCLLYSTASTATTPAKVVVSPSPLSFFLSHHHRNDNSNDRHRRRNNHRRCSQRSHSPNCVQANSAPSCPVSSVGDNSFTAFPECIEA